MGEAEGLFSFDGKLAGSQLVEKIESALGTTRTKQWKRKPWLSPSVLTQTCPRALTAYIRDRMEVEVSRSADLMWRARRGPAHHYMIQTLILGPAKVLLGGWVCSECGHVHGTDEDDDIPVISHGEVFRRKVTARSAVLMPNQCEGCGINRGGTRISSISNRCFMISSCTFLADVMVSFFSAENGCFSM